jgi:hypothetical protein
MATPTASTADAIDSGQDDARFNLVPRLRPPAREGFDPIQHDQRRGVGGVDLGDHGSLGGGVVKLGHVVVAMARHALGSQADRILERQGEVAAETVRLEVAGLDDGFGFQTWAGQVKAAPMAVRQIRPPSPASIFSNTSVSNPSSDARSKMPLARITACVSPIPLRSPG